MRYASLALLLAFAHGAAAQLPDGVQVLEGPFTLCVLEAPEAHEVYHGVNELRQLPLPPKKAGGTNIEVTYDGFSGPAQLAFEFAADIWERHLESDVTIRVTASYEPLGTNVLGSAGALRVYRGFAGAAPDTWYGDALADAIAGQDFNADGFDIRARFSSNFSNWYFGLDGNPAFNQVDFVTVVLHELGHGLGFFGSANVSGGVGEYGIDTQFNQALPVIYDRFVEDPAGTPIVSDAYPNPSGVLGNLLQSGTLFWGGVTATAVFDDARPPVYSPAAWERGSSFSHFDEDVIPTSDANALMTPRLARGEAFLNPGPLTCALFKDIGWTLAEGCNQLVVDTEGGPLAEVFGVEPAGPNPFRDRTALRVSVDRPQAVRATLYDAVGREVTRLYDGQATGEIALSVPGAELAPGVYTVRVEGETASATHRVVRVR